MDKLQKFMETFDNKKNLFCSSLNWLFTCVIITITPTSCLWLFRTVSTDEKIPISEYLDDTLLIVFTIACSIVFLLNDKDKLIEQRFKRIVLPISIIFAFVDIFYYFYISDKDVSKFKYIKQTIIVLLIIIVICSIFGVICEYRHEKNNKKMMSIVENELINKDKKIKEKDEEITKLKIKYER